MQQGPQLTAGPGIGDPVYLVYRQGERLSSLPHNSHTPALLPPLASVANGMMVRRMLSCGCSPLSPSVRITAKLTLMLTLTLLLIGAVPPAAAGATSASLGEDDGLTKVKGVSRVDFSSSKGSSDWDHEAAAATVSGRSAAIDAALTSVEASAAEPEAPVATIDTAAHGRRNLGDVTGGINSGKWYTFHAAGIGQFVEGCSPTSYPRQCPGASGVTVATDLNPPPWTMSTPLCTVVSWTETWNQENRYELWVNGRHAATGTVPGGGPNCGENPTTCFFGGLASRGVFYLPPGRQSIQFKSALQVSDRGAFRVDTYPCPAGNLNSYIDTGTWFNFETNYLGDATIGQGIPSPWTFYSPCPVEFSIVEQYFSNNRFEVYDSGAFVGTTNVAAPDICRDGYIDPDTGCLCLFNIDECIANGAANGKFRLPSGFHSITIKGYPSLVDYGVFKIDSLCMLPTNAPTRAPTRSPTKAPTKAPTKSPTRAPAKAPTKSPTRAPTPAPVQAPSKSPTKGPTKFPTKAPTQSPRKVPTKSPTNTPTKPPTKPPTKSPTRAPNKAPTKSPTHLPSAAPTSSPSHAPTSLAEVVPTRKPTGAPKKTSRPSAKPRTKAPVKPPTKTPTTSCPKRGTQVIFEYWNGDTDSRVTRIRNSGTYCLSGNWNIRAVTPLESPDCGAVRISLTTPSRATPLRRSKDPTPPYFLYGDNATTGDVYGNTNLQPRRGGLVLTNGKRYCIRAVTLSALGYSERCFTHSCQT